MNFDEISVVVQGDIDLRYIYDCLSSLRYHLPGAEIILSTWKSEKEKVCGLPYDILVLSDDPGSVLLNKESTELNNLNRQIISTQAGLRLANRKYIFKFRSNMKLDGTGFLRIFSRYANGAELFDKKLLITNYFTRNPRVLPMPFHPSDWVLFGLGNDVKKYYTASLQTDEESLWFSQYVNKAKFFQHVYALFAPEQHICLSFLKQHYDIKCNSYDDARQENIIATESFFAKNMVIVDVNKHGIKFMKYNPNRYYEKSTLLFFDDWKILNCHYDTLKDLQHDVQWLYYMFLCFKRKCVFFCVRSVIVWLLRRLHLRKWIKQNFRGR